MNNYVRKPQWHTSVSRECSHMRRDGVTETERLFYQLLHSSCLQLHINHCFNHSSITSEWVCLVSRLWSWFMFFFFLHINSLSWFQNLDKTIFWFWETWISCTTWRTPKTRILCHVNTLSRFLNRLRDGEKSKYTGRKRGYHYDHASREIQSKQG